MSDELKRTKERLEQGVEDELNATHRPYRTITRNTCSLTIPDDNSTEVTIKTKSAGVCYASSPEDALKQMECDQKYAQKGYTSHILRYVTENLPEIDLESLDLTYTGELIVTPMTDDVLSGFQREVVSLYAY